MKKEKKADKRARKGWKSREQILEKRNKPIETTVRYFSPAVLGVPDLVTNPLLKKVLKSAGEDFKFPGNKVRESK
jgi:hypothetical protein